MWTLVIFTILIYILYRYLTKHMTYWECRNVPFIKPTLIFGNFFEPCTMKKGLGFFLADMYNEMKHPFFGIWVFHKPYLIIKSPDLIKSVLQTDFDVFSDRTVYSNEKTDHIVANMLFFQKYPEWKRSRKALSPAFSSGKLKAMMPLMDDCAQHLVLFLNKEIRMEKNTECKSLFSKYMVEVVASCIFGLEVKAYEDDESKFITAGRRMFEGDVSNAVRGTSHFFIHWIADIFKMSFLKPDITKFLSEVFTETINYRESSNINRSDLVDILLQYKQDDIKNGLGNSNRKIIAQAIQFYIAGFETSSSTMAFTLYEMCINKEYQNKLREDIFSNIKKHGGLKYEAINDMKYLHNCLLETLRKYPVLPFLDRLCGRDYQLPGTEIIIEKGTPVYIPMYGLHYDPEYFPDPERFDPDRFTEENSRNRHNYCYLPFGEGPHNCIGARLGLLAAKLGLINVLLNFEVHGNKNTPVPVIFDNKSLALQSMDGLQMTFTKYQHFT